MLVLLCAFANAEEPKPDPSTTPAMAVPAVTDDRGLIEFDSRQAAEIHIDNQTVAQLFQAGVIRLEVPLGQRQITVITNGLPRKLAVDISRTSTAVVFVGRNGLTANSRVEEGPAASGIAPVEFRILGKESVMITVGKDRHTLAPGKVLTLDLAVGKHPMTVKSGTGTTLWARGSLEVAHGEPIVVQLSEGRMPEVSGHGASFNPG